MEIIRFIITIILACVTIAQFVLYAKISRTKGYNTKKGENLATKEDIANITREIESVKNIYSTALEEYKFQLQNEFETKRYSLNFCNTIDTKLIELIVDCLQGINREDEDIEPSITTAHAFGPLIKLNRFLHIYQFRYSSINIIPEMVTITNNTFSIDINNNPETIKQSPDYIDMKENITPHLKKLLSILLPKLNPDYAI